jgi:hypothetical protein
MKGINSVALSIDLKKRIKKTLKEEARYKALERGFDLRKKIKEVAKYLKE